MVVVWIFKNRSLCTFSTFKTSPDLLGAEKPSRQPRIFERFGWVQRPGASLGPKLQEISTKWGFPHLRWSSNCPVCRCEGSGCVSEMWSKVKSEAKNELGIPYTSYHGIPMLNQCQPARDTRHAEHASFPRLVFFGPGGRFHFYSYANHHKEMFRCWCLMDPWGTWSSWKNLEGWERALVMAPCGSCGCFHPLFQECFKQGVSIYNLYNLYTTLFLCWCI